MKKYTKLIVLTLILLLTACSLNTSLVEGKTYIFDSCTMYGEDATEEINSIYEEQKIEFQADGVCVQTVTGKGESPVVKTGTYKEEGNKVTASFPLQDDDDIVADDENIILEFTLDGDTLTHDSDGIVTVYKAQ